MKKFIVFQFIFFSFHFSFSQKIDNLVFEGAGIRGIAFCGSLQELENRQMLKNVQSVAGTSAGAVTAMAVSLGYTGKEIEELIRDTDFKKFNQGNFSFIGGINRLNKYFGWYRSKRVDAWLGKIIEKKTGDADISFQQLHEKGFKDLYVTGTCLNKQRLIIFSRQTYPAMKVRDAVRISMSIPFYFEAVFIDSAGRIFSRSTKDRSLDLMVDGGYIGNFPLHIFDSLKEKKATIGFRIDSDEQILSDQKDRTLAAMPIRNFSEYLIASYNLIIENLNRAQLTEEDWKRTISISDGDISPRIRKLSKEETNILIENGRKGVRDYFERKVIK